MASMTTVRARPERNTSRLRVFREEEFGDDDDAFAEEPTSPSQRIRIAAVDPLEQTDINPHARIRPAKVTEPLPLPRPPNRR
jgi:hypothetical protein